jgi:hypothetical protein
VHLRSHTMFDDLIALGLAQRKSTKNILPVVKPESYSHFVRGVFDGDGCIGVHRQNYKDKIYRYPHVEIVGSRALMEDFNTKICKSIGIPERNIQKHSMSNFLFRWRIHGDEIVGKFYNYIYPWKDVACLKRKRDKFEEFPTIQHQCLGG